MRIIQPFFILLIFVCFTSCDAGEGYPCVSSNGNIIEQVQAVPIFHSIENRSVAEVHISQTDNNEYSVRAVGSSNVLSSLRTQVSNGKLIIDNSECISNNSQHSYKIYVRMPRILSVELTKSGKIIGDNSWYTDALVIKNKASGEIDIEADATHLTILHDGSGKIKLYGVSPSMSIEHTGSGNIMAYGLYCKRVEVLAKSSGDTEVAVTDVLNAHILGSGDIRYKGYPLIDFIDEGSGNLVNRN